MYMGQLNLRGRVLTAWSWTIQFVYGTLVLIQSHVAIAYKFS